MKVYHSLIYLDYIITNFGWAFFELVALIVWIAVIRKFSISANVSLKTGLCFLIIAMLFILMGSDTFAGKASEISFLLISIGYVQSFINVLKSNKK